MVDGIAASVYIDFLGTEVAAHSSAAKYRLLARLAPRLTRWMHARGLNQPFLLFMAETLPKVIFASGECSLLNKCFKNAMKSGLSSRSCYPNCRVGTRLSTMSAW